MSKIMLRHIHAIIVLTFPVTIMAAGPLALEGPTGNTPVTYNNPNITFNIETGPLGPTRDNDAADQLVRDAFAIWNTIPTSTLKLGQGADIPVDIDSDNFNRYIPDPANSTIHNDNDCLNPVVYDSDGSIIDTFFGTGASDTIVGFAASSIIIGQSYFTEGFAVINGKTLIRPLTDNELKLVIAHELGHAFGLDHTQADIDNTEQFIDRCPSAPDDYPLMYPYACRIHQLIHPDDAASASMLYPADDYHNMHGQLSGNFLSGTAPVPGANIWVEEVTSGAVYSVVSDYLKQGTGFFSLMLPPGTYTMHANSINTEFYAGSSVGPYASGPFDLSFQPPASTIGSVTFDAGLVPPALLAVTAGEATRVTFRTDGGGSFSTGHAIIDLSPAHDTSAVCTISQPSGGGGNPSLPLLIILLGLPVLRSCSGSRERAA